MAAFRGVQPVLPAHLAHSTLLGLVTPAVEAPAAPLRRLPHAMARALSAEQAMPRPFTMAVLLALTAPVVALAEVALAQAAVVPWPYLAVVCRC